MRHYESYNTNLNWVLTQSVLNPFRHWCEHLTRDEVDQPPSQTIILYPCILAKCCASERSIAVSHSSLLSEQFTLSINPIRASSTSTPIKTPFQLGFLENLIHQSQQSKYISQVLPILDPTIPQLAPLRSDPFPHKCTVLISSSCRHYTPRNQS